MNKRFFVLGALFGVLCCSALAAWLVTSDKLISFRKVDKILDHYGEMRSRELGRIYADSIAKSAAKEPPSGTTFLRSRFEGTGMGYGGDDPVFDVDTSFVLEFAADGVVESSQIAQHIQSYAKSGWELTVDPIVKDNYVAAHCLLEFGMDSSDDRERYLE